MKHVLVVRLYVVIMGCDSAAQVTVCANLAQDACCEVAGLSMKTLCMLQQAVLDDLEGLKAEDFEFAINLLANRYPKLVSHGSEELDVDVSPMDALTLRQLAAFQKFARKGRTSDSPTWPGLLFGAGAPYTPCIY